MLATACGSARHAAERAPVEREPSASPFVAAKDFEPVAFGVKVSGRGRPMIFIPTSGVPATCGTTSSQHLGDDYESHVLTLRDVG